MGVPSGSPNLYTISEQYLLVIVDTTAAPAL